MAGSSKRLKLDNGSPDSTDYTSESDDEPEVQSPIYASNSNFFDVLRTSTFVDKTLLIEAITNERFILINAPRKFGKSTNMHMLKVFFGIEVDLDGKPVISIEWDPDSEQFVEKEIVAKNYKLFKHLNLKICQKEQFFFNNCGQFPVMFIDFKPLIGGSFDHILIILRNIIRKAYMKHDYLLCNQELWLTCSRDKFMKYLLSERSEKLTKIEIEEGLHYLSEVLHTHFEKRVVILIDDYDTPFADNIFNENKDFFATADFIGNLVSYLLHDNKHVERVVINACVHSSGAWLPNNITFRRFLHNHGCSEFYGFTETEVKMLFEKFNLANEIPNVKNWFNGYKIHKSNIEIYNIWSVLNYLNSKVCKRYLTEYSDIKNLKELLSFQAIRNSVEALMNNETVTINYNNSQKTDVDILKKIFQNPTDAVVTENFDLLFRFLYEYGYLSVVRYIIEDPCKLELQIPNKEVWYEFEKNFYFSDFYVRQFNFNEKAIKAVCDSLVAISKHNTLSLMTNLAKNIKKLYAGDVLLPQDEFQFQATFYTFIKNIFKHTYGEIYTETGKHLRTDIVIVRADKIGLIFEFTDNNSSKEALQRILTNKSYEIFNKQHKNDVNDQFYIGLHLNEKKQVDVCYLLNSINPEEAVYLSID